MSFVDDLGESIQGEYDAIRGKTGSQAAEAAADVLVKATKKANKKDARLTKRIGRQISRGEETARNELLPFRDAGIDALSEVQSLINDPTRQKDFVTDNPFFKALADDAQRRIFNNQASKGKVGSGGTAEALQNSILLLGNDLLGEQIDRQNGLVGIGANASDRLSQISENSTGNRITNLDNRRQTKIDLLLQGANAEAAGIVGFANGQQQGVNNRIEIGKTVGSFFGGGGSSTHAPVADSDDQQLTNQQNRA